MSAYRYILEPYKGIATRHTCPACEQKKCFSHYIDTENKVSFPNHVGRCDREEKCGYHFTPKQYFEENPEAKFGMRLPHPEEWPMVPSKMLDGMCVVVTKLAADVRGRQLVEIR